MYVGRKIDNVYLSHKVLNTYVGHEINLHKTYAYFLYVGCFWPTYYVAGNNYQNWSKAANSRQLSILQLTYMLWISELELQACNVSQEIKKKSVQKSLLVRGRAFVPKGSSIWNAQLQRRGATTSDPILNFKIYFFQTIYYRYFYFFLLVRVEIGQIVPNVH